MNMEDQTCGRIENLGTRLWIHVDYCFVACHYYFSCSEIRREVGSHIWVDYWYLCVYCICFELIYGHLEWIHHLDIEE
jgi:hypothetical protein